MFLIVTFNAAGKPGAIAEMYQARSTQIDEAYRPPPERDF